MARQPAKDKPPTGDALVAEVERLSGVRLSNSQRLDRAFTHSSVQGGGSADYERLEFLGDRVLGLVVADMLFETFPEAPEGELSVRFNALVNAETLAAIADEIGVTPLIRAGAEFGVLTGRKRVNTRSDVMEALIAAIYLDAGLEAARGFVLRHWRQRADGSVQARRDAKTELQEWAHRVAKAPPSYRVEDREGPDHDPVFTVSVHVEGYEAARGEGRSKREAEQAAATVVLEREGIWKGENG